MKKNNKKTEYVNSMDAFADMLFEDTVNLFKSFKVSKSKKSLNKKSKPNNSYVTIGDDLAERILNRIVKSLVSILKIDLTFKKVTTIVLLFSFTLGVSGMGSAPVIGYTLGFYEDNETSEDNSFIAGEVDFLLNASSFTPTTTAISLSPGDTTVKNIDVDPQNSNPFKYTASTTNVTGDTDFCDALNVDTELEGTEVYDNSLVDMLTDATTTLDSWKFTIGMGASNFQNSICNFDTEYFGSQTRHDYDLGEGYNDTEIEENTIASWGFRINKVYYDVAPDRGEEGANEWVEIYNQTNVPLNIDGWEICDNNGCDVLSVSENIPAMGYGFITASSTTASNVLPAFWYLPQGVVEISIPDSKIGNGLNNDADMLVLKRPDGVIIDQMNWGEPDEGWNNWNENIWNPGATDVAEGNSLARVPSGYDTNQASDWTELIPPSVDLTYPDEAGSYNWYWGYSYTIEWSALNNNGDDEDLDIRIFYVKDINSDSEISDGDIMFNIAETTANDGEYDWTVPSGFTGFIWIYLLATGPENPMWNSGTISGDIWDPIPLFIGPTEAEATTGFASLDTEAPVITISGNNPTLIEQGSTYSDLGATVTDDVNPNIGISTEGSVDTSVLGEYQIIYHATDQAGNTAEAIRIVIVYDPEIGPPIIEETVVEETTVEEIIETPVIEEPIVEEPIVEAQQTPTATEEVILEVIVEEEPIVETATSTATTTEEVIAEEPVVEETATTTEEVILEVIVEEPIVETATTTATTTEEVIVEEPVVEEIATTTEEVIVEEPVVEEPEPEPDTTDVVVEEPALIEEPVIEPTPEEPIVTE